MREEGGPSFKTSSRFMPAVTLFKSSAVTAGGGGGGVGATSRAGEAVGADAGLRGAVAAWRADGIGGGGGTESGCRDWTFGTPGPTSRIGSSSSFLLGGEGTSTPAALEVCLSTLLKILVSPSLTFFPATPPTDPPAAAAAASVIAWPQPKPAQAVPVSSITNTVRLKRIPSNWRVTHGRRDRKRTITLCFLQKRPSTTC